MDIASASILVIGTDSNFCYLMSRYVKKSAHAIAFAYHSADALAMAKNEKPAAIILEVDQPDSSGWLLLQDLKKDCATKNIPIVLCSWQEEEQRVFDEGADAYLRKPILYNDFLKVLAFIGIQTCS